MLDRPQHARSQFVFTNARGRPAVWWQTQKTVQSANPGARVPRGRPAGSLVIAVDNREKYGWKFAGRQVTIERRTLPAGDYGAMAGDVVVAVVERKTLENLATSLSDGSLVFQLQRLAEVGRSAIVVEGDYPDLFRTQPGRGSWLADMLGRLAVRYPRYRSCSPARAGSPRSGLSAFSGQPSQTTPVQPNRLCSQVAAKRSDLFFEPHRCLRGQKPGHLPTQLWQADRLNQVAIYPLAHHLVAELPSGVGREGDDLDRMMHEPLAKDLQYLHAIVQRHMNVEYQEIELSAAAHVQRTLAIEREANFVPL